MIQGTYIDRSTATITAHALQRFNERCRLANRTALLAAWKNAVTLLPQPWWRSGVTSYWVNVDADALFIVKNSEGLLTIVTVQTIDQQLGNPKAGKALAALRKAIGDT